MFNCGRSSIADKKIYFHQIFGLFKVFNRPLWLRSTVQRQCAQSVTLYSTLSISHGHPVGNSSYAPQFHVHNVTDLEGHENCRFYCTAKLQQPKFPVALGFF